MPVLLEITDGSPWWMSPNIWTVPGNDPEGPPGLPVAGAPVFLWARVINTGSPVTDATVRFYWADPSVGFDRTTAHHIGTSFVSLASGASADVLCLTPWIPDFVNNGHECVLAEAFDEASDPLPAAPTFNVPTDRHVAQRNLSVLESDDNMLVVLPFVIVNLERKPRDFEIRAIQAPIEGLKPLLSSLGTKFPRLEKEGKLRSIAFVDGPCPKDTKGEDKLSVRLEGQFRIPKTVVARVEGGAALIHVEQWVDKVLVGGLSILSLPKQPRGMRS